MCVCVCSVTQLCPTLATPWTRALQAPLSMGVSRQECWSGWPCPSPGGLPDPGIKLASLTSPATQETSVLSLGREDPLEKGVATLSSSCLENPMDRAT